MAHHTYVIRDPIVFPNTLRQFLELWFQHHAAMVKYSEEQESGLPLILLDTEGFVITFRIPVERQQLMEAIEFYGLTQNYKVSQRNEKVLFTHGSCCNKVVAIDGDGMVYNVFLEPSIKQF